MQISHAGRQSPRYVTREPLGPSAVQLKLMGNYAKPRALTEAEILDFIQRYARVAATAREAGFTGAQIHAAHGYLLSSFLSPVTNQRNDDWGGSLENRARMLLETVRATRRMVGDDFPVSIKLNSADFQKGGFTNDECLTVVKWLNAENIDLLEVSGGNYEQPKLLGYEGKDDSVDAGAKRESTVKREAYFLEYAERVRKVATMPMMVTGGFRTRTGMEEALDSGDADVIGLGRPLCVDPALPGKLLSGDIDELPRWENKLSAGPGILAPTTPVFPLRIVNVFGQQGWYYIQLLRMGAGKEPDTKMGVWGGLGKYLADELKTAARLKKPA